MPYINIFIIQNDYKLKCFSTILALTYKNIQLANERISLHEWIVENLKMNK